MRINRLRLEVNAAVGEGQSISLSKLRIVLVPMSDYKWAQRKQIEPLEHCEYKEDRRPFSILCKETEDTKDYQKHCNDLVRLPPQSRTIEYALSFQVIAKAVVIFDNHFCHNLDDLVRLTFELSSGTRSGPTAGAHS